MSVCCSPVEGCILVGVGEMFCSFVEEELDDGIVPAGRGFVEGCIAGSIGIRCVDIIGDGIVIGSTRNTGSISIRPGLQKSLDTVEFTVACRFNEFRFGFGWCERCGDFEEGCVFSRRAFEGRFFCGFGNFLLGLFLNVSIFGHDWLFVRLVVC